MTRYRWLLRPERRLGRWQIERAIDDPELRRKLTPRDEIGCKRIMLTDDWYPALAKPNVEVVTERIAEVIASGIRTEDGSERPADVLVLATGFRAHEFVAPMEIAGEGGRTLAEAWGGAPRAYLGITVPEFPNLFLLFGPNTNGGTGSVIFAIESAMAGTVWHSGCTNWYVDEKGHDPNQWPWQWSTYRRRTARLEPADYELAS